MQSDFDFEEVMDAETKKFYGIRRIERNTRAYGYEGRMEFVQQEPLTLTRGTKSIQLNTPRNGQRRLVTMKQGFYSDPENIGCAQR